MTPEQRTRLQDVAERLTEVAIRDADPDNWTASEIKLNEMTREERGDAAWCRKTAVQTISTLLRVQQVLGHEPPPAPDPGKSEDELVREAEAEAQKLLDRMQKA